MKRTIVYIDGYNLFFGLLKGTPWKWLDVVHMVKSLLTVDHEIVQAYFFTSIVTPYPYEPESIERQNVYLQALALDPLVRIVKGKYCRRKAHLPPVSKGCLDCDELHNGYVRVYKFEEKQSDVNLAVQAVHDAALNLADSYVIVTGDSDQVGTILSMRKDFGKQVIVLNPHEANSLELKMAATFYRNIPRDLPAKCQLPDEIPVGTHGNVISRPAAWR